MDGSGVWSSSAFPTRSLSSSSSTPTAILMLNMGGPRTTDEVGNYLERIFLDREIIRLPFAQEYLGRFIARRRTPKVKKLYASIGGGSPILHWTETQGKMMVERLDRSRPESAPHRPYVAFRYAHPLTEETLSLMEKDGIRCFLYPLFELSDRLYMVVGRVVAFSQFPQWSCATSGSSLNELWRQVVKLGYADRFQWSVLDSWATHEAYIDALVSCVQQGLNKIADDEARKRAVILFSAHSLPIESINRGDPYPAQISATIALVMKRLGYSHRYQLSYQSRVGPVQWLGPYTDRVVESLGARGEKSLLVVPIAFTTDHIETLSEIDIELREEAEKAGFQHFARSPMFNDMPEFADALAKIVSDHLDSQSSCTAQYSLRCPMCSNEQCRKIINPIVPLKSCPEALHPISFDS